ncbi:hypothetical protein [Inediibacterium massiliense]|nr:hypothetical protein [Inediibacterium massiliense]
MEEMLVNMVIDFIDLCDDLLSKGKISEQTYIECTKMKLDFLENMTAKQS